MRADCVTRDHVFFTNKLSSRAFCGGVELIQHEKHLDCLETNFEEIEKQTFEVFFLSSFFPMLGSCVLRVLWGYVCRKSKILFRNRQKLKLYLLCHEFSSKKELKKCKKEIYFNGEPKAENVNSFKQSRKSSQHQIRRKNR
jgi:hypothetical protein